MSSATELNRLSLFFRTITIRLSTNTHTQFLLLTTLQRVWFSDSDVMMAQHFRFSAN